MGLRAPIPGLLGWLPKDASYWLCVLLFGKQLHTYTYSLTRRHIPSVLSSFPHLLLSYAISLRITWEYLLSFFKLSLNKTVRKMEIGVERVSIAMSYQFADSWF